MERASGRETAPLWLAVQCATRGRSHVAENIVCQDKTFVWEENGIQAFALADGAGSAVCSHYGAAVVTEEVCRLLCQRFSEFYDTSSASQVKEEILHVLIQALERTAVQYSCGLSDLASTLLAVAVTGDRYLILHVGDGVIGYSKNGLVKVASAPNNGEFCNTTYFVTSRDAGKQMRILKGEDSLIDGFVLMSDGCEASLYSKQKKQLAPVLQRLLYRLSITSAEFLTQSVQSSLDNVIAQKTRDDCSLVLAARRGKSYAELSAEEQNDYYDLDADAMKTTVMRRHRVRFTSILNALSEEKSDEELARALDLKDVKRFVQNWLTPLLEMGYVVQVRPHRYRKTVGLPGSADALQEENAEAQDYE